MLHGAAGVMRPQLTGPSRAGVVLCLLGSLLLSGCQLFQKPPEPETAPASRLSLLEDRLLKVLEREHELDALAARPDADRMEVQRQFHAVAREYNDIIARNPDHLESRLLYGKLLMRYGDADGARDQFLLAARLDPEVAVIHQQLSTYFAEQGDPTRALAYALNAIEYEPETAAYHFALGQLLVAFREEFLSEQVFSVKQLETTLMNAFQTAAELEPETLPLQFRYGEAFYDVSNPDWEKALAHWTGFSNREDLTQLQQDAITLHRVRCLLALERSAEARKLAESIRTSGFAETLESLFTPSEAP